MIRLNKQAALFIALLCLSGITSAANFVCAVDKDGNGDVAGQGETASCSKIGNEQFCTISALSCVQQPDYKCDASNQIFKDKTSCSAGCPGVVDEKVSFIKSAPDGGRHVGISIWNIPSDIVGNSVRVDTRAGSLGACVSLPRLPNNLVLLPGTSVKIFSTDSNGHSQQLGQVLSRTVPGCQNPYSTPSLTVSFKALLGNNKSIAMLFFDGQVRSGYYIGTHILNPANVDIHYKRSVPSGGSCTPQITPTSTYACPVAGNSCLNYNGVMQCSPNKCLDIDINTPITVEKTPTMTIDDGVRNAQGVCTEQASLFAGRNLSCRKSGVSTAFKNCCKGFDKILRDNTGSSSIVSTVFVIKGIYKAVSAGYSAYTSGGDVAKAIDGSFTGIDPYSIAINLAIKFALQYLLQGCNQQDMETGMLDSSGYCVEIGEYCKTKWPLFGCVQQAKGYCCFNSKMARIIQEQGRPQLGLNFGSASSPSCNGFTPQQFQSLDFSKIDMSEYYNDIQNKADSLIKDNINKSVDKYYKGIGLDYSK